MKKIFVLLGIFSIALTTSCSMENGSITNEDKSAVQEIKNEENVAVQRVMYNILTPEEKHLLWTQKIDALVNSGKLNVEQVKLLSEVKNNLTIEYFNDSISNDKKEIIKIYYMKNFLKKAQTLFNNEFIYYNFFSINSSKAMARTAPLDDFTNCGCHRGTIWTCGVISPVSCKIPDNYCRESNSGCGLWYSYPCDGECRS